MSASFRLDGLTAVVTGSTGRLGRAFAHALGAAGARLVLAGRSQGSLDALAAELGESVLALRPGDLTAPGAVDGLLAGLEGVDILVNAAGAGRDAPLESLTAQDMHEVYALNVTAPVLCAQAAVPLMRALGGGKVVFIGSIYGTVAANPAMYADAPGMVACSPAYAASKSALTNLTRDLAVRLAPDRIQVNLLSPGGVEAGQPEPFRRAYEQRTPAGRLATPEDMAGPLVFLCSPASNYVTGQNLVVDGGLTAW